MAATPSGREALPDLPGDSCPYHRPFPAEFEDCPAFIPRSFVGFDLHHRPLREVLSCRHLTVGDVDKRRYPRCSVGDASARVLWAASFHEQRLENLRRVSLAFQTFAEADLLEVYRAKGEQLRSPADGPTLMRLREASAQLQEAGEGWLEEHSADLDSAGLPLEACKSVLRLTLDQLVSATSLPLTNSIADEQLAEFPVSVRDFLRVER